ncbi:MAG: GTP diphosphokinase [Oceanospirillaceae bacterium]|nr:GTP diphosphokinase [Oceanospirillaceae bacterium]
MVKVREDHPINEDGQVDIDAWIARLQPHTEITRFERIRAACELSQRLEADAIASDTQWSPDMSSFRMGMEMAEILVQLHLDEPSLVAALVYRGVREGKLSLAQVSREFDEEVARLVEGVLQMAAITASQRPGSKRVLGQQEDQVDHIRKMLVAMIDDVRVALIKLAERTSAIRAVKNAAEEKRMKVAREVFDIYAPLAHRLGIGHIKWELEDLSFRYLEPVAYKKIAKLLDEKRLDRQGYIENVVSTLNTALKSAGIECQISGRAKHIYSIWRKMRRKNIDFSQVYDIRAVRILVPEVKDCYAALGIVHAFWRHIPNEFDDYIANAKENGYRSLHTAVIGPEGKVLEVQIRTFNMHDDAELGVCAHWRYKGTDLNAKDAGYEQKIAWLRQVLEWHEEIDDLGELVGNLRADVTPDRIYLFTPDGHVVDLPPSATPVDFAYRVHTEIGHRCRGAKVNGRIVPLTYQLRTGEQVEILTSREAHPSRDWLNTEYGYVRTPRARAKVAAWFKSQARDQNMIDGKALIQPEFERMGIARVDLQTLTERMNFHHLDDLYAALGNGTVKPSQVMQQAQRMFEPVDKADEQLSLLPPSLNKPVSGDVHIRGVGKLLTVMASCCHPVPGDQIMGYITQGRGVSIHKADCGNLLQLQEHQPKRIIDVSWGDSPEKVYPVEISVRAFDRRGLLKDITGVMSNENVNVLAMNTLSHQQDGTADMLFTVEIDSLDHLGRLLGKIDQLSNVLEVKRHHG